MLIPKEAGQGKVVLGRGTAVLLGDDVVMGKVIAEWACGRRQYSQQWCARSRTRVTAPVHGSMTGSALLQGKHGFSPQQIDLQADLAVVPKFVLLLGGELAFLVPDDQLVHAFEVVLIEGEREKKARSLG
jgi:hypothetical protein